MAKSPAHGQVAVADLFRAPAPQTVVFFGRLPAALTVTDALSGGVETPLANRIVVIGAQASGTSARDLEQLLGRCINLGARGIVLDNDNQPTPLPSEVLRSLNFEPRIIGNAMTLQIFDADSANRPRDWNTPDKWAHPERFKRRF